MNDDTKTRCFPKLIEDNSTTLILGTIPGVKSLDIQNYYAHKRNQFWDILVRVFDDKWDQFVLAGDVMDYSQKKLLLNKNNIALWDVIACCDRVGSSDKDIKNAVINDFEDFFQTHPGIKRVIFNGTNARKYFTREYKDKTFGREMIVLNSSSTTNPNNTFSILKEWKSALNP